MYASSVCLGNQFIPVLLGSQSCFMPAGAAYTAAFTNHTLNEIFRQLAQLEKHERFLAVCNAAALCHLNIGAFTGFLQAFYNGFGHAAAIAEAFSEYAGFLTGILFRLQFYAFGTHHSADFPESQDIVRIPFNALILCFRFFADARPDKYGNNFRILSFQHSGYRAHRGNCGGDIIYQFREMFLYIVNKSGTAGGGHFLAFFEVFRPFFRFKSCSHIAAQAYFHEIGKAELLHSSLPARHGNVFAKLSFTSRSQHGHNLFPGTDFINDIHYTCFGCDGSKRTIMDTLSALNTFRLVDLAYSMLIHGDRAYRAALHTGSLYFYDCRIGTGLGTFSAALALILIDERTVISDSYGAEIT